MVAIGAAAGAATVVDIMADEVITAAMVVDTRAVPIVVGVALRGVVVDSTVARVVVADTAKQFR